MQNNVKLTNLTPVQQAHADAMAAAVTSRGAVYVTSYDVGDGLVHEYILGDELHQLFLAHEFYMQVAATPAPVN